MKNLPLGRILQSLPPKYRLVATIVVVGVAALFGWNTGLSSSPGERSPSEALQRSSNEPTSANPSEFRQAQRQSNNRTRSSAASSDDADFAYYTLTLSWSPTHCESAGRGRDDRQCNGDRPYAFVLHGLWPQHERGWPEHCTRGQRAWVPNAVIRNMLDIMPSRGLIIHEYKKHGTCSGLDAKDYFSLSRRLYEKVRIPPRYIRPSQTMQLSPREIENDFLTANPSMDASMISVVCGRRQRLKEVRICFSKRGRLVNCGPNESQRKLCSRSRIRIPPVRIRR